MYTIFISKIKRVVFTTHVYSILLFF